MRWAIDARYVTATPTGIGRYTLSLLRGIAEVGPAERVGVLVGDPGLLPEDVRRAGALDIVEVPGSPFELVDQAKLPGQVKRLGVRLLHSPDVFGPLWPVCRRIITIHDLIPLACRSMLHASVKARIAPLWRLWLKAQCRAATRVITDSAYSAEDIQKWLGVGREKVRPILLGVEPFETMPPTTEGELRTRLRLRGDVLLYVGRRDPYKHLAELVRAFGLLLRNAEGTGREMTLVMVGPSDPRHQEPEAEAKRLGIEDHVVSPGFLSDGDLAGLYAMARVFVFPSLYEGFGLPILEAMRHGTPVVASNRTSIPEVAGDAAILVVPTAAALAEAAGRVLEDGPLAKRLSTAGRERAEQFSLRKQAEATLAVYEEVMHDVKR